MVETSTDLQAVAHPLSATNQHQRAFSVLREARNTLRSEWSAHPLFESDPCLRYPKA